MQSQENNTAIQSARRFREVMLDGTWIANTNYKNTLEGLPFQLANKKVNGLNSIENLVRHIHYYIHGVKNVLKGGPLTIRDRYSFDFSPFKTQSEWDNFLENLWEESEEFARLAGEMSDEAFQNPFIDPKYGTYQRNIDGMTEHCYYHLGQIVLIKKLLLHGFNE